MSFRLILLVLLIALGLGAPVRAEMITGCDRLAANPPDPDRVTEGVERADVDLPAAIAACRLAVDAHPDVARFSYQLGRVLFYDGQTAKALESFQRAIDMDYRQAKFLVGLIMTRGYNGVPDDPCRVERLWRASARQDHFNAQISYVRLALQGRFDGCGSLVGQEEMRAFLDSAAPRAGYLGALLAEDLRGQLD